MKKIFKTSSVLLAFLIILSITNVSMAAQIETKSGLEEQENIIKPQNNTYTIFYESSRSTYLDSSKTVRVSPETVGGKISYGFSVQIGYSANTSLSIGERMNIGGTWSADTNKSFGVEYQIPDGRVGWVEFTPRVTTIRGALVTYFDGLEIGRKNVVVTQPNKVNGFADGRYYPVVR